MTRNDDTPFDPSFAADIDRLLKPMKQLLSPVALGLDHVPPEGAVLLAGNHSIYGLIDIPMLGLEIYEHTGRVVRGLGDHIHFSVPGRRDLLGRIGAVPGTRENCGRLFEQGEVVLVFPGGGREVMKHKGEKYRLVWKERIGFAKLAIQHGVPIVPFASVGVEDMFEILLDAEDVLHSPVGRLIRSLGIMDQPWFRGGEVLPPVSRGTGPAGLPRIQRQYFLFGAPIDTQRYAGQHEDREVCFAVREEVKSAIETQLLQLQEVRDADPERYPIQRILRRLARSFG
ncbi:MAG: acyltransferase family protein [bacterium]|nr:acyltransferase family protein [bacterium]